MIVEKSGTGRGGFRARQIGPGSDVWRTPHGHYLEVDRTGTHPITSERGEMLLEASRVELCLAAEFRVV